MGRIRKIIYFERMQTWLIVRLLQPQYPSVAVFDVIVTSVGRVRCVTHIHINAIHFGAVINVPIAHGRRVHALVLRARRLIGTMQIARFLVVAAASAATELIVEVELVIDISLQEIRHLIVGGHCKQTLNSRQFYSRKISILYHLTMAADHNSTCLGWRFSANS